MFPFLMFLCLVCVSETFQKHTWKKVKMIIRYLKGTKLFKVKFRNIWTELEVSSNEDQAEDRNHNKSLSSYILKYIGNVIVWSWRKLSCSAWSSCNAEYIALVGVYREYHPELKNCLIDRKYYFVTDLI